MEKRGTITWPGSVLPGGALLTISAGLTGSAGRALLTISTGLAGLAISLRAVSLRPGWAVSLGPGWAVSLRPGWAISLGPGGAVSLSLGGSGLGSLSLGGGGLGGSGLSSSWLGGSSDNWSRGSDNGLNLLLLLVGLLDVQEGKPIGAHGFAEDL